MTDKIFKDIEFSVFVWTSYSFFFQLKEVFVEAGTQFDFDGNWSLEESLIDSGILIGCFEIFIGSVFTECFLSSLKYILKEVGL